jgi:succinate-semialdehyde dehydrogenase/glutarate-semialdehyde dehydrogenase
MDDAALSTAERLKALGTSLLHEHAIVGERRIPAGPNAIAVHDPSDGSVIGQVPRLDATHVEAAIAAADRAFGPWSRTPKAERARLMRAWAALIEANTDALAALLSLENGKPFAEARGEIAYANSFNTWFAGQAESLHAETIESPTPGQTILTFKEPVGPVAAITPWNFPAAMVTRKLAPALAAGCTVVLKPASQTPFTAVALLELAFEAGIPAGVLNLVTGENDVVGPPLTASPRIRKLSFTGSTPVGKLLMDQSAPTLKKLSMELGGAAPMIIFDDMDVDRAVAETIKAKFRNSGQTCVCPNRVYVQRALYDDYLERLTTAVSQLKVGGPFEPDVKVGPLIEEKGVTKVEDHIRRAVEAGARILTGGERHELGGLFHQPTVLAGGDDALFTCEETFGPVVPVFAFDTEAQALERANDSPFGLASYVLTRDLDRAFRMARGLEAGMVGVNTGLFSNAVAPFGGVKESGFGREGSIYGMDEYLVVKAVTLALDAGA